MLYPQLFIIATHITLVFSGTFEHIQFFNSKPVIRIPHRTYRHLYINDLDDWSDEWFPLSNGFDFSDIVFTPFAINHGPPVEHSPINDPFLLTGEAAKRAARVLYREELFFKDIPHLRAINNNQQLRVRNGLPPHKMGSLRPNNPWYRGSLMNM